MKIRKLNEDIQHCWFGYYLDSKGNKKYFYMTKDSTSKDPDEASEIMENSIPEPFTKFVFQGSVANTQAEKQGMKLIESKASEILVEGAYFQVGDEFEFSGLYGGNYNSKVIAVHPADDSEYEKNTLECETRWTNEDTGKEEVDTDNFEITTDSQGNECIVVWEYAGEKGYVYPPSAQHNTTSTEASIEDTVKQDAKEMYEMGVECWSYEDFEDFMKQNKKVATKELYQIYADTIDKLKSNDKITESKYQDISNVDLDNDLVKDLVARAFDYNQAQWLVDNNIEYAKHLAYDNVSEEEIAKAEEYLTSKGYAHQVSESYFRLNESLFREDFDDDKYTASRYLDTELPDICDKVLEMLDVLPSHKAAYITKICRDFYAKLESIINSYTMTNESLHEDVTDVVTDTLSGPTEGPESGLSSVLNQAIQDEFKTIQMYNDIAVSARAEGFENIATVVDEINTEENKHVGQLQELLKTVSPNAKAIDTGEIEGQQQIGEVTDIVEEDLNNSNSSPNNNIEEDDKVMKESWEEVYQSFKTIEKELNGDGEAITATIDQLYRDNKGNPDYEKAYKKWASGE